MAITYPRAYLGWLGAGLRYNDGTPLDGGLVEFFEAGTASHKTTYSDANGTAPNPNPVVLDAAGRATVFVADGGYDVTITDTNGVLLWTVSGLEDIGLTWLSNNGITVGATNVTNGYTILPTDSFVTVDSSAGVTTINLPPAAQHPTELTIKNLAVNIVNVTPSGTELLENTTSAYAIPAASGANLPSIVLVNDGVSTWWIKASHGF